MTTGTPPEAGAEAAPGPLPLPLREARMVRRATAFGFAGALLALVLFGPHFGVSVLAGAAVSVANLRLLRRMAGAFTGALSARAALRIAALTGLRYLLLGAVLFAIIGLWNAEVIGVVCGLGAPLPAILLEVGTEGFGAFRTKPPPPQPPASDSGPPQDPDAPPKDA